MILIGGKLLSIFSLLKISSKASCITCKLEMELFEAHAL